MKKMRMIATSILLFQNCFFTATAFAEAEPVEIDTELVQRLQEQSESPATEGIPIAESEPEQTLPDEPADSEDLNQLQPDTVPEPTESVESSAVPETVDSTEITETNKVEKPVLTEEKKEEEGETPTETPEEVHNDKMMELPFPMRMSTYSLPNLNQYRPYLVSNGESSYIQRVMQSATSRSVTLGAEIGATASFTTSFSTSSLVNGTGADWIAYIGSDKTAPEGYYTQMYYGNHSTFRNTYTLNNVRGNGTPSYLQVTPTVTSINNYQVTLSVTIRRTATTTSNSDQFNILGNLTLGTTVVAPLVGNSSKNIENVNYQNAVIGNITINNEQPAVMIKDSVVVEATRSDLSQDTIKTWFSKLPANANDYTFSATGPVNQAPGTTGTATVAMKHNSNGTTQTFTTRYTVRDTQKPTAKFKKGVEIEARRTGGWTRADLLKFIDGDLQDNWSLPDNIRIEATNNDGVYPLAGRAPGNTWAYVDIYDEAGNQYGEYVEFKVVDTQAPTGIVKSSVTPTETLKNDVTVEARRSGDLSQSELRGFFVTLSDNWTLTENIKVHLVDGNGTATTVAGKAPGTHVFYLQLEDEAGNKSSRMSVQIRIVDSQAPTGTVKSNITIEARRSGDLSEAELRGFIATMSDNWTLAENIKVSLVDGNGTATTVAGKAPGTHTFYLQLEDEAGNKSSRMSVQIRIVDSQAPTGTSKGGLFSVEARRSGDLSQVELRRFFTTLSDNWTLSENIKIQMLDILGNPGTIAGFAPGTQISRDLRLEDEAGNKSYLPYYLVNMKIVDTQAPTGTVKSNITIEARRSGDLSEAELRGFIATMSDNWTLAENIKVSLVDGNGTATTVAGKAPGTHTFYLQLEDEAGNKSSQSVQIRIVDTQKPTGSIRENVEVDARRTGELSQEELNRIVLTKSDNWTLAENIKMHLVQSDGSAYPIAGEAPGVSDSSAYIQLEDEAGNKSNLMNLIIHIVDRQAPTGTVKSDVTVEVRRSGELSQAELRGFFATLSDNWTLAENIKVHLVDGNGTATTVAGKAPGTHTFYLQLEDEAGNKSSRMSVPIRIVDSQAPTGTVKSGITIEARKSGDLSQAELRGFMAAMSDNWTAANDIKVHLVDGNGTAETVTGKAPSTYVFGLQLEDEAGNKSYRMTVTIRIVDSQAPTGTVKSDVTIEARRSGDLSQAELQGFFATLSDNWTLTELIRVHLVDGNGTATTVAGKAPGTHAFYLQLEDEAGNKSSRMSVTLRIVDMQAPTGTVKSGTINVEARRSGNLSEAELRGFMATLSDNWTLPENLKIQLTDTNNNPVTIAGIAPGQVASRFIKLEDEAGNQSVDLSIPIQLNVVDTQAPTTTIKTKGVEIEARRSGDWERADLLRFIDSDLKDNWSLPENIRIQATNNSGVYPLAGRAPGNTWAYIDVYDEAGNKYGKYAEFDVVDTQAPTGTVKSDVTVEARRSGDLSQAELRGFFATLSDNWTLTENIKVHLLNGDGTAGTVAGKAPGSYVFGLQLEDEAGNKSSRMSVPIRIVDTQAPTGSIRMNVDVEARRTGELSQLELNRIVLMKSDNWTVAENIKVHLVKANGSAYSIAGIPPGVLESNAYIQLEDEAGNKSNLMNLTINIVDTVGPQGTLKENLAFYQGSAEPKVRDYLEGEPSDNWTAPEAIKVTVVYENKAQFADLTVGTHQFVLTLADEYGNTTNLSGELEIKRDLTGSIDVTVPVRISFAESKKSGGIVSPKYQIQNNSNEELTVSLASMTSQTQTEKLTDINLLMSNNYNDSTIPLIKDGQNLSQKTELVTLPKKTSSFAFSLHGTVGQNFDFDSLTDPLKPQYSLQFNFAIN